MTKNKHFKKNGTFKPGKLNSNPDFGKLFQLAHDKLSRHQVVGKETPYNSQAGLLKRVAYQIGKHILCQGIEEKFQEHLINTLPKPERVRRIQQDLCALHNPFYWCITCILTNSYQSDPSAFMGTKRAPKLSRQLGNAYRNDVPLKYLVGYIYQTGGKEAALDEETDEVEESYEDDDEELDSDWLDGQ